MLSLYVQLKLSEAKPDQVKKKKKSKRRIQRHFLFLIQRYEFISF